MHEGEQRKKCEFFLWPRDTHNEGKFWDFLKEMLFGCYRLQAKKVVSSLGYLMGKEIGNPFKL